jgi:hypothetical protein
MPFIIIYGMKLECDFSHTRFEAMILWIILVLGGEKLSLFLILLIVYHASLSEISLVYYEICRMSLKWKGIIWNI